MIKTKLPFAILASTLPLLAACSSGERGDAVEDVRSESTDSAAPGVDVTAAPGVAFNYRYAFRLPSNRISRVQEAHAQACERLGLDRCRITGMRYRLVGERDIDAMLRLRLDPRIARNFGKQATETVTQSEGMLVDQEITGEDVGSRIQAATKGRAELQSELSQAEIELTTIRPTDPRRGDLVARVAELREQIRSLGQARDQDEEALAGTPMVFDYGSGNVVPGFDMRSPLREALRDAGDNFVRGLAMILVLVVTLLPWLLIGALGLWLYRKAARRLGWSSGSYRDISEPAPPQREDSATA